MSFRCEQCERVFAKKSKLNRHVRETHMNIKQYICEECGKNFKRNSHLKRHLISRSENPKPHKCSYEGCYMAFTCKHHLERHIKIIHIEEYQYKCTECDAKFPKKVSLNKHLTFDHGKKKPLTCQLCHKSFFKLGQLEYHHCEEKFKQLNLELETVGTNPNIMIDNNGGNTNPNNSNHIVQSTNQASNNTNNIESFHAGLVNDDSGFHSQHNGHHISMLHDDQHHQPNNIPVIDISQFSRKHRQREYNYPTEYSSTIAQNNAEMTPELGAHLSRNQNSKLSNMNGQQSEQNEGAQSNVLSNRKMNESSISLTNQIHPPIKKKFKPDYLENQNFSLSGDQQPLNNTLSNKQDNLSSDPKNINDLSKQLADNLKQSESNQLENSGKGSKIIKTSFDGMSNQNEVREQYFKQKHISFSSPSIGVAISPNQITGLLLPEGHLQATLAEQSKITEQYNKVSIKVEEPANRSEEKKDSTKSNSDLSDPQQQSQQQPQTGNQVYFDSIQQENIHMINNQEASHDHRDYMQDAKQEYDTINLDLNNTSDIHGNYSGQGIHGISQSGLYLSTNPEYHYKSPSIKPNGRKLSELFNIHDFKERKNSFNSDYGNLTIFKDLFLENSFNSRRPSMNITEAKNHRKGSLFHLQKMEEDGIIVDLDINQNDMNSMLNPSQSQEIHHHLQTSYDQLNNQSIQNVQSTNLNSNGNRAIENNYASQGDASQLMGGNSQQFISNSTILSQLNINKTEEGEEEIKQTRFGRQGIQQRQQVMKQGFTSNNPQLHHHIYQQREVSPQMQFNPESAKVGYAHSPYIPLVVRSKSPSNKMKKEEKCYKCNYADCDKFYTKLSNLKTHIRTFHFKSKDFKCNYQGCKSAYLHKKSLKEHIARVHKQGGAYIPGSKRNSEDYEYSDEQQMNQMSQNQQKEILPKIQYDDHGQQQLQLQQQQQSNQNQYVSHHSHPNQAHHHHHPAQQAALHHSHSDLIVNPNTMYGLYVAPSGPTATINTTPTINYHQQFTQQQQQQQQQQQSSLHPNSYSSTIQTTAPFYAYPSHQHQSDYPTQSDTSLQIPLLQQTQSQQSYQSNVSYPQLHRNLSLQSHHPQQTKSSVFMA